MTNDVREIGSLADLAAFAQDVATAYQGGRLLILLDGGVGAGKTQFTRFLLSVFGSDEAASPSFAIHNHYETPRAPVEHVDLYRLDDADDLESTGFWDLFSTAQGVVIVEWADRLAEWGVEKSLPTSWPRLNIRFEILDASSEKRRLRVVL